MSPQAPKPATEVRVDKWLWAARFFKTRGDAAEAIKGGKIDLNGHRVKPARNVKVGDQVKIRRGAYETVVTVLGLSAQRGSATTAQTLYQETADSIAAREVMAEQLKLANEIRPRGLGRPSKRDRRALVAAKNRGSFED